MIAAATTDEEVAATAAEKSAEIKWSDQQKPLFTRLFICVYTLFGLALRFDAKWSASNTRLEWSVPSDRSQFSPQCDAVYEVQIERCSWSVYAGSESRMAFSFSHSQSILATFFLLLIVVASEERARPCKHKHRRHIRTLKIKIFIVFAGNVLCVQH